MQVDAPVRLPRDGAPHHVHDAQHAGLAGARRPHRLERVRRLPRLGDRQRQGARLLGVPAVAVLRRILDGDRNARQLLDEVPTHEAGVPRRPARENDDALHVGTRLGREVQAVQPRASLHQAAAQGRPHGLGLLADLLVHEVLETPQLDGFEVPGNVVHRAQLHALLAVEHVVALRGQDGHIPVVEVDDRTGMLEDGRRVRSDEVLVVAYAEQHRRAAPRDDDLPRLVRRDDGETVRPLHVLQSGDHPRLERVPRGILDEMREDFRVRVRSDVVAGLLQCRPQRVGVFDDPVVHQRQTPGAVGVRVSVSSGGRSVRRPARMGDAAASRSPAAA